jgi:hypothetical protein
MDPNLFNIDYERLIEVLSGIVLLSLLVERSLALLFESKFFIELVEPYDVIVKIREKRGENLTGLSDKKKSFKGLKELITLIVSFFVVWLVHFDALTIIFASSETVRISGMIITAAIIAGGSKGSIALFQNWLGWMSDREKARKLVKS